MLAIFALFISIFFNESQSSIVISSHESIITLFKFNKSVNEIVFPLIGEIYFKFGRFEI